MRIWQGILAAALMAGSAWADQIVAARTVRSLSVIGPDDIAFSADDSPGAAVAIAEVLGKEARVMLYPGRPIRLDQIGPPALIERNQIVTLVYQTGGLRIETEARALDRAGLGDAVRVMNLASRKTVSGTVQPDGSVAVGF
jgi:flagella basal body P-ring formation protein FlgA